MKFLKEKNCLTCLLPTSIYVILEFADMGNVFTLARNVE